VKRDRAGFALVGTLILTSITSILLTVAQKATIERRERAKPAQIHLASVLAEQKLRELSAQSLTLSPDSSLEQNTAGFVEYLDKQGVLLEEGLTPAPQPAFIRRWSISPVPANPDVQVVIRVLILPKKGGRPIYPVHLMMVKNRVAD
jgi:hypothetical protein